VRKYYFISVLILLFLPSLGWTQASRELDSEKNKKVEFKSIQNLEENHFESETKAGLLLTSGNTQSLTLNSKHKTVYRIKRFENTWLLGAYFNRIDASTTTAATGTIGKYIFGTYRLDYYFTPRFTIFSGGGGFSDEIKGINKAGQIFLGVSYYFLQKENYFLRTSVGYSFALEDRAAALANQNIHSATLGLLYEQQLTDIISFSQGIDLQENVKAGRDLRLQSDTGFKVKLNDHFALSIGYQVRFDNEPVLGFKKLDTLSDLSLAVVF